MIVLLTDYGLTGLYVGQLHAVIKQHALDANVIDLIHSLPRFNIRSAAYLLPAYTQYLPTGTVILSVIDPGVGGDRPHAVVKADGRFYVGPDNGLFDVLLQHALQSKKYHIDWQHPASNTFHGRDVYAPIACRIHQSGNLENLNYNVAEDKPVQFTPDLAEIIYIDSFGNAITGIRFSTLRGHDHLSIDGRHLRQAGTFSDVSIGECFWYENANGLIEIAANQASVAETLDLNIGDKVSINSQGSTD